MPENNKNKNVFSVETDGKKIELALKKPNANQTRKAQLEYNKAFAEAIKSGALLKAKLNNVLSNKVSGMTKDKLDMTNLFKISMMAKKS